MELGLEYWNMFSAPKERSGHVTLDGTIVHKCICQGIALSAGAKITGNWKANTYIPFAAADHKE